MESHRVRCRREFWFDITVDGGNPAPSDIVNIPLFAGITGIPRCAGCQPSTLLSFDWYLSDMNREFGKSVVKWTIILRLCFR